MKLNENQGAAVGGLLGLLLVSIVIAILGGSLISFLPMAVSAVFLVTILVRKG